MTTTTPPVDLPVPTLGESVSEATITSWVAAEGSSVHAGDVVAELETDKATVELPANAGGILHHVVAQGVTVAVGQVIARIAAGAAATAARTANAAAPDAGNVAAATSAAQRKPRRHQQLPSDTRALPRRPETRRRKPSWTRIKSPASGKDGRLTKGDVLDYLARTGPSQPADSAAAAKKRASNPPRHRSQPPAPQPFTAHHPPVPPSSRAPAAPRPLHPSRRLERMIHVSNCPSFARPWRGVLSRPSTPPPSLTTFNEIDLSAVMQLREKYKDRFEKTHGIGLGFMSFFARAVCHALTYVPAVNAMLDGSAIVYRKARPPGRRGLHRKGPHGPRRPQR